MSHLVSIWPTLRPNLSSLANNDVCINQWLDVFLSFYYWAVTPCQSYCYYLFIPSQLYLLAGYQSDCHKWYDMTWPPVITIWMTRRKLIEINLKKKCVTYTNLFPHVIVESVYFQKLHITYNWYNILSHYITLEIHCT